MRSSGAWARTATLLEPIGRLSLRREIVMMLLILAETTIVFIYSGTLFAERAYPFEPLPVSVIFAVLLIAYQIPHLLETIRVWSPEYEAVMAVGLVGTLLMVVKTGAFPDATLFSVHWGEEAIRALILRENDSIRPVWPLVVLVAYAWARGRTRAEPVLETSYSMLRLGMIWTVLGLLLNVLAMPADAAINQHFTLAVGGFVLASLLAIALSRNQAAERVSENRPVWTWMVVVALPVLVIAAATISVAGVLTREMLDVLVIAFSPVFWIISILVQIVILLIAVLAFIIIAPIIWILERQGIVSMAEFPSINLTPNTPGSVEEIARSTITVADPIRYLIATTVLAGLVWVLIRFAFRRRRGWAPGHRQQSESLIEWQPEPAGPLQRATAWVRRGFDRTPRDPYPADPRWDHTRRVRRIYRAFLQTSRRHQIVREPHDTPDTFAGRVIQTRQQLRTDVRRITDVYNLARYSGKPVDPEDADVAERANQQFEQWIQTRENG